MESVNLVSVTELTVLQLMMLIRSAKARHALLTHTQTYLAVGPLPHLPITTQLDIICAAQVSIRGYPDQMPAPCGCNPLTWLRVETGDDVVISRPVNSFYLGLGCLVTEGQSLEFEKAVICDP